MFASLTLGLPGFLVGGMNYNYTRIIRFMKVLHSLKLNYLQSWTIFSLCRQVVFSVVILLLSASRFFRVTLLLFCCTTPSATLERELIYGQLDCFSSRAPIYAT